MNSINFFTPVYFCDRPSFSQKLLECVDNYFYLGGKKAEVLQGKEQDKTFSVRIADYPNTKWDMIATALKVATYFTLVAPLLMLVLKAVLRSSYQFEISEDSQKNSSSPPLPECHFPPLAEEDLYNDPKGFMVV